MRSPSFTVTANAQPGDASARTGFGVGDLVEMTPQCPLESEGVAPVPGDAGEVVAEPAPGDGRHCWEVRFLRTGTNWLIPEQFLRRATVH